MDTQKKSCLASIMFVVMIIANWSAVAAPPSQEESDIYSSLCNTGSVTEYALSGTAKAPIMDLIIRRTLKGEIRLSASELKDKFPKISDEDNLLHAMELYQDCVHRYVEHFHSGSPDTLPSTSVIAPSVPLERRREIVYFANQLDDFKLKMRNMMTDIPETYYDKKSSRETKLRNDGRIFNIDNYNRYKAFLSPSGILDFSNLTNNDIALICDILKNETKDYHSFYSNYRSAFGLQPYSIPREALRICLAANKGR